MISAPDFVIAEAQKALGNHINQYTRANGHVRLVNALAAHYSPKFERKLDPMNDIGNECEYSCTA